MSTANANDTHLVDLWNRYLQAYRDYDACPNAWENPDDHTPEETTLYLQMDGLEREFEHTPATTPPGFALKLRHFLRRGVSRPWITDWVIYGKPMRLDNERADMERRKMDYGSDFEVTQMALDLIRQCEQKAT
ncbi:hypothetical protein UAJ10_09320 [Nitrospirillum sp. BR 11164]|uniref:hypothetical protein n=1 Tax=Nitrospirillum sp. BR 11164 TaxID=3104324 RepID=UPI002AFF6005|nr:hypothetical protein [Nitrospirillum sp. BR 11164]MEA1649217.1 hypothetical protein [Nitrospirillum sp. BR 11164]